MKTVWRHPEASVQKRVWLPFSEARQIELDAFNIIPVQSCYTKYNSPLKLQICGMVVHVTTDFNLPPPCAHRTHQPLPLEHAEALKG